MIKNVAQFSFTRRRWVLAAWLAALIALGILAATAAGETSDAYSVPGAKSEKAGELLADHGLSDDTGDNLRVVFADPDGVSARNGGIDSVLRTVETGIGAVGIETGLAPPVASPDGTVAYVDVALSPPGGGELSDDQLARVADELEGVPTHVDGLSVDLIGDGVAEAGGGGVAEGIGILAAVVILLIAFGSLLAMGLPILVALFGAGTGVATIMLVANVVEMPGAAVPAATMLAVGVGIDYSLLMVTRYRELLAEGVSPRDAVARVQLTSGRSVLFAGVTVIIALLGLLVMNIPLVNGVAIGAAIAVAVTMLAALTLMPAMLGFVGRNIDRFGLPHRRKTVRSSSTTWATGWSRVVQRRPWVFAISSLAVLIIMAIPVLDMRLGFTDDGDLDRDNTSRRAYDTLADGFGPGVNGPLFVAVDGRQASPGQVAAATTVLTEELGGATGVESVSSPIVSRDGEVATLILTPTTAPDSPETSRLVTSLRENELSGALAEAGLDDAIDAEVTGVTAAAVDFSDYSQSRLPLFLGVILALAFLLLMVVFRSVLVPLKAVIVNVLSIGAAFGVIVAVFQWGWGLDLVGLDETTPIVAWVPMMLVALVFGLSMDYEVFLLSRIKEHYDAGQTNTQAVAGGLASTARVITAAALIMICVFGSFVFGADVQLAMYGFGLATAILIDATLVRMVLVPAVMELMGDANWWFPGRARRPADDRRVEAAMR